MRNFFFGLLGGGAGLISGLLVFHILAGVVGLKSYSGQLMVGTLLGALIGALVAAVIGGDPDAHADSTAAQGIWGGLFGTVGGLLGSSNFQVIGWLLQQLH